MQTETQLWWSQSLARASLTRVTWHVPSGHLETNLITLTRSVHAWLLQHRLPENTTQHVQDKLLSILPLLERRLSCRIVPFSLPVLTWLIVFDKRVTQRSHEAQLKTTHAQKITYTITNECMIQCQYNTVYRGPLFSEKSIVPLNTALMLMLNEANMYKNWECDIVRLPPEATIAPPKK